MRGLLLTALLTLWAACLAQPGPGSLAGVPPLDVSVGLLASENYPFSQLKSVEGQAPQMEGFEVRKGRQACQALPPTAGHRRSAAVCAHPARCLPY